MTPFGRALEREIRHLLNDRWDLAGLFAVPGVLMILIAAMLWQGPMRHLPIAVVDSDGSAASRAMVRALEASPMVRITSFHTSEASAVRTVRQGEAIGFVHLPNGLGEGLARHRKPVIRILYNGSFLSAGSQASRGAADALADAASHVLTDQLSSHAVPPVRTRRFVVEATALGNSSTSFEWFLGVLIYPSVLHLVAACVCAFALGRELRDRSLSDWACESGGIAPALAGKMLPYVVIVSLWGLAWLLYITLGRGWRIEGSVVVVAVAQTVFFAATAAIAALLIAVTREAATALSASAVYAGSALAYSGATLPLNGANIFAQTWSNVLPLPHYIAVQMGQISGMSPLASLAPMLALSSYIVIAGGGAVVLIARHGLRR